MRATLATAMLPRDSQRRSLAVALMLHIGVTGGAIAAIGALIPQMIRELGWSYTEAGLVLAAGSASFVLTTVVVGFLMPLMGVRITVAIGLSLEVAGLLLFGVWPGVATGMLIYALLGVGFGMMEVAGNDLAISMERGGRGQLINLLHAAFAVGGIIVPWASSQFLSNGGDWRLVYRVIGIGMLFVAILVISRPTIAFKISNRERDQTRVRCLGKDNRGLALLVVLQLTMGVYVAVELGLAAWLSEFIVAALGEPISKGGAIVSLYWGGLFVGRLGTAILYRGTRHPHLIMVLASVAVVGMCIMVPSNTIGWTAVGTIIAGLGLSALYPLLISVAGTEYSNRRSQVIGLTSASGGIGAMLVPLAISTVAETSGIRRGMIIYLVLSVTLSALSVLLSLLTRKKAT